MSGRHHSTAVIVYPYNKFQNFRLGCMNENEFYIVFEELTIFYNLSKRCNVRS